MRSFAFLISILSILLATASAFGRTQTGFLDRVVSVHGTSYRYQVYVPADYISDQKWPVILFLHGAGERGNDGILQTDVGLGHAIRQNRSRFPFIVVMPQCLAGKIWGDPDMQAQALAALDAAMKEFHGDRTRVYLTGLSMGGFGTWELAARNPRRFAAIVPICSGVRPVQDWPQLRVTLVDDPKIADPYAEIARRIGKVSVWMFHGDADEAVPVTESRNMAAALKAAGDEFKYTEYPGVHHDSWDKAYAEPELSLWLLSHTLQH